MTGLGTFRSQTSLSDSKDRSIVVYTYDEGLEIRWKDRGEDLQRESGYVFLIFDEIIENQAKADTHTTHRLSNEEEWRLFSRFAPLGTQVGGQVVRTAISPSGMHDLLQETGWELVDGHDSYRKASV